MKATGPQEQGLRQREGHRTVVLPHATIAARRWTRNGLPEAPRSLPCRWASANSWLCGAHTRDATRHAARVPPSFPLAANQLRATHGRTRTGACVTVGCQLCVCVRGRGRERKRESVCVFAKHPTPRVYPASPLSRRRAIQQTTTRSGTFGAVPSRGDLQPVPRIFTA